MTMIFMAGHKGSPYYDIFLRYEIWLETINKTKVLDGEGFALLLEIDKAGSLNAAARSLGMSYRKAWGILRDVERHLEFHLVEKRRGGAAGGRTDLSAEGRQLIRAYNSLHYETDIAMKSIAKVFFNRINEITGSK
jgi:molybdate transport system regulatory protein